MFRLFLSFFRYLLLLLSVFAQKHSTVLIARTKFMKNYTFAENNTNHQITTKQNKKKIKSQINRKKKNRR